MVTPFLHRSLFVWAFPWRLVCFLAFMRLFISEPFISEIGSPLLLNDPCMAASNSILQQSAWSSSTQTVSRVSLLRTASMFANNEKWSTCTCILSRAPAVVLFLPCPTCPYCQRSWRSWYRHNYAIIYVVVSAWCSVSLPSNRSKPLYGDRHSEVECRHSSFPWKGNVCLFSSLDLSSAFDNVDHKILSSRLRFS